MGSNGKLHLQGGTFSSNRAYQGSGLYLSSGAVALIEDTVFDSNSHFNYRTACNHSYYQSYGNLALRQSFVRISLMFKHCVVVRIWHVRDQCHIDHDRHDVFKQHHIELHCIWRRRLSVQLHVDDVAVCIFEQHRG
jgi:hypothetical protein